MGKLLLTHLQPLSFACCTCLVHFKKNLPKTQQHRTYLITLIVWIFGRGFIHKSYNSPKTDQETPAHTQRTTSNNTTKKDTHTTHQFAPVFFESDWVNSPFHHPPFRQPGCCFFIPGSTCPKDGEILGQAKPQYVLGGWS